MSDKFSTIKQFIKFCLIGISNVVVSLGTYYLLLYIFGPGCYIIANTVGFVISVLNSYYWNNKFVFKKNQNGHVNSILKTFLSYGTTFIFSNALLIIMVQYLGLNEYISPIICNAVTTPVNFLMNKYWAFK